MKRKKIKYRVLRKQSAHPNYGEVLKTDGGLIMCHICGLPFLKLGAHVVQTHKVLSKNYKFAFGLDRHKGLLEKNLKEKLSKNALKNEEMIKENLLKGGSKNRFKLGAKGRTRDKMSEQTRKRLISNITKPEVIKNSKDRMSEIGKSGIGNKTRWEK